MRIALFWKKGHFYYIYLAYLRNRSDELIEYIDMSFVGSISSQTEECKEADNVCTIKRNCFPFRWVCKIMPRIRYS